MLVSTVHDLSVKENFQMYEINLLLIMFESSIL